MSVSVCVCSGQRALGSVCLSAPRPLSVLRASLQAVAEGAYAQVVVAMADGRRRSPTSSDVAKGLFDAEKLRRSFVSLTSRCDKEGTFLVGDQCNACPSGGSCPGARPRP